MDFTTLQTEFFARGHDELNDAGTGLTRAKRWINEAMHEINGMTNWPYLETTSSGTAPLTVATVRQVLTVTDNTHDTNLQWLSRDQLERLVPDFSDVGDPSYYYFSSPTQISVYPANTTATIEVLYVKNATDLSAGGDTPDMPSRYHGLIVDLAAYRAYLQKDNPEIAQNLRAHVDRMLGQMQSDLLVQTSEPDFIISTEF